MSDDESDLIDALRFDKAQLKEQLTQLIKCVDEGLSIEDVGIACRAIEDTYAELRELKERIALWSPK